MPMRDIVAGEAQLRSWVSNRKFTFGPNWMRSPLGIVNSRLSSSTEFRLSIHSGSMSPSHTIQEFTSRKQAKLTVLKDAYGEYYLNTCMVQPTVFTLSGHKSHILQVLQRLRQTSCNLLVMDIHQWPFFLLPCGSLTTFLALWVRTPSDHSLVSISICPSSCCLGMALGFIVYCFT